MNNAQSSTWWLLRLLAFWTTAARWWVSGQELDPCQRYLNFQSEKDVSVLSGKWFTLGSTRRVFPCNSFEGFNKSEEVMLMEETWMVPGYVGVWKQDVKNEVKATATGLEVTEAGFNSVLTTGQLALGVYGNDLLVVQCTSFLWFPSVSVTVFSREVASDPATEVEEIFRKFDVPVSIPHFDMVNQSGCDKAPQGEIVSNGLASRRSTDDGQVRELSYPGWRIRSSRDRFNIFSLDE